ncbi:MAG TPA: thiol reductant ABC exporter subunit CydD, partial [Chloroflexi bacterium]|nr:thiol reductant ABC exporter subunit CydD [Chloroflexota bacterium]
MNLNRRLLSLARRPIAWLALTVALGLLGGGLIVLQAALLASVLDAVFLQGAGLTAVRPILLTLVAVLLLRAATAWGCEVVTFHFAAQIKRTLRRRLLDHLIALGPVHLSGERTGEITNALTEGLEELETYFRRYLPQVVLTALVPLLVLIVVFPRDWI